MESHKLEITLHSAKGLLDVKFFGTMDPYAIVWIAGDGKESKPRTTAVAKKGASSPIWNCPMQFNLVPMDNNYILFCEIKHDGKLFDRKIGQVQVPFADLLAGNASGEKISYLVKTSSGEESGEIIVSHKFSKSNASSGEKNGNSSGGKVDGGPRKKVQGKKRQRKKVEEKKKGGMLKHIAGNVATKVVTEAVLLAGTVAAAVALDNALDETDQVEEDGDEDDEEYEDDEEEDEYEEGEDEYDEED